jgi:hypothetical protein
LNGTARAIHTWPGRWPAQLLRVLVERGELTAAEAELASRIPIAEDITVEADSGGHTDNRPLTALLPAVLGLRDALSRRFGYPSRLRVGAAGGLGSPQGVAAAFALGAAYVVSSRWAIRGDAARRTDYQLWCGPAMGAFNRWVAGSFLAEPANRSAVQIARNLLAGAAVVTRAHQLRTYAVPVPAEAFVFKPRRLS